MKLNHTYTCQPVISSPLQTHLQPSAIVQCAVYTATLLYFADPLATQRNRTVCSIHCDPLLLFRPTRNPAQSYSVQYTLQPFSTLQTPSQPNAIVQCAVYTAALLYFADHLATQRNRTVCSTHCDPSLLCRPTRNPAQSYSVQYTL